MNAFGKTVVYNKDSYALDAEHRHMATISTQVRSSNLPMQTRMRTMKRRGTHDILVTYLEKMKHGLANMEARQRVRNILAK